MGEAKLSQHAGHVDICVAECKPEFIAKSSQYYYFTVSQLAHLMHSDGKMRNVLRRSAEMYEILGVFYFSGLMVDPTRWHIQQLKKN